MDSRECVSTLIASGDIPADAEVVSTNNKVVVVSPGQQLVTRICSEADLNSRDDPHDIRYSHRASWLAAGVAPVVGPIDENPVVRNGFILSSYPMLRNSVDLSNSALEIHSAMREFGDALDTVSSGMNLRRVNIASYVGERLVYMRDNPDYTSRLVDYVVQEYDRLDSQYPFDQLVEDDTALIHGDFKVDNMVADPEGNLKVIDLDAVAVGPRLYDIASWMLRCELGDKAPIQDVVELGRLTGDWNEDAYRSLLSWKAISSMSFTLRYENPEVQHEKVSRIAECAAFLGGIVSTSRAAV